MYIVLISVNVKHVRFHITLLIGNYVTVYLR